jgi:hypothetical protein
MVENTPEFQADLNPEDSEGKLDESKYYPYTI